MGQNRSVLKKSGSLLTAANSLSSPPPKSTFFWGSSLREPSACFWYWMKTELAISRKRPQSQLGWHFSPYLGSCFTWVNSKKTSESGPPISSAGISAGVPERDHQFLVAG